MPNGCSAVVPWQRGHGGRLQDAWTVGEPGAALGRRRAAKLAAKLEGKARGSWSGGLGQALERQAETAALAGLVFFFHQII